MIASRPWWSHPPYLALMAVAIVLCALVGLRLLSQRRRRHWLSPLNKVHCWQTAEFLHRPTYCNSCTQMCFSGSYCVSCGLCICTEKCCAKMASSTQSCKPLATPSTSHTHHFWVKGNLPLYSLCFKCLTPCGNLPKLVDFRCVWCQHTVHEDCVEAVGVEAEPCTLGPHQSSIIPPSCITVSLEGWRGRRRYVVLWCGCMHMKVMCVQGCGEEDVSAHIHSSLASSNYFGKPKEWEQRWSDPTQCISQATEPCTGV